MFLSLTASLVLPLYDVSGAVPFSRAVYEPWNFAIDGSWNFSELSSFGFDAFYSPRSWSAEPGKRVALEEIIRKESVEAKANNMSYIVGLYYSSGAVNFNYSHAVDEQGRLEPGTPSPVDENWWHYRVEEPALFVANLSLYYPITAVVWDMELYASKGYFEPWEYSFDDAAIVEFANETNHTIPHLPPERRYDWLSSNSLLDDYEDWMAAKAYRMAKRVEGEVHSINPKLGLGILGFLESWFHWSVISGFNSSEAPVSAWYEWLYWGYFTKGFLGVDHFLRTWEERGLNGVFLSGIIMLPPWEMLSNIEAEVRHQGTYWIYQRGYPENEGDLRKVYSLVESHIYYNRTKDSPRPVIDIPPGVVAKPYLGPGGACSVFLEEAHSWTPETEGSERRSKISWISPPTDIVLLSSRNTISYVGRNFSVKTFHTGNLTLRPADLPCMVFGLDQEELMTI